MTTADDPNLPSLSTIDDWRQLTGFFCIIEMLNVLSPETYQAREHVPCFVEITPETALLKCDINKLTLDERQSMCYARGLAHHAIEVLSNRFEQDGDVRKKYRTDFFGPSLAYRLVQISAAFEVARERELKETNGMPTGIHKYPEHFKLQLQWIAGADIHFMNLHEKFASCCTGLIDMSWEGAHKGVRFVEKKRAPVPGTQFLFLDVVS